MRLMRQEDPFQDVQRISPIIIPLADDTCRILSQRRKEPKTKQVSVSTQAVTEEKETKGAISISTQTVTEAEQPKPVAVAPVQKKKSKSKSVRTVTEEDVAGPSHPAEETEPEIITRSLSLGELRDLRREFTRQTNESILTWLLRIWDAAANDTILDGSEARQLGSLSRDVVIDQGIGRTQQTLSLWRRLLTSVRDRYLCKEDLQVRQGKWSTMEQGIRCLRELAVLEIIFSEDERFPKSPDDVQCTSQMWLRFARLGPEMYSRYLATLQWREGRDYVGVLVNKLRIYEDTVTAPFRTHVSSVETRLAEQVRSLIEEGHQKLKKELKEEIYHISPEPTRVSAIRSWYPPARDRGYTPRGNLWSFPSGAWRRHEEVGWKTHLLLSSPDDSSAVGLLRVEEQRVTNHHSNSTPSAIPHRDSVIPIHEVIRKLESQGVVSKARSPFNSPIWPQSAGPSLPSPGRACSTPGTDCPRGGNTSPTICHGLIQTALEKGEAPEHLQYIDDIIVWGNTAGEVFEKGEKIIQILLKAGFAIKRSKVKGPAQEIQSLGVKWQDGRHQITTEVINKMTAMSPPTNKKETQAFPGAIDFWRMHIPEYSQIVSPLYLVTRKKNDFHWGPEQQQAFAQIKQEIAHAVALVPVRTGPEVKNVLYSAAGNNGLSWSLGQKTLTGNGKLQYGAPHDKLHKPPRDKEDQVRLQSLKSSSWLWILPNERSGQDSISTTDSWMVANALWGWLNRWKKANWQCRGKPIWAAEIWQDIAAQVEKLTV
ncbi:hypothetical protein DUI87_03416 [Hirundo rustica rustica]|uniref:ribonuclease H n=1 Tax=Hirundo rustica rustica TaxID=333673 RepID=A0A3M0L490_HIRRU|nr:hypothetical protein DUI87_03416 [Hirundo rustica rustica]